MQLSNKCWKQEEKQHYDWFEYCDVLRRYFIQLAVVCWIATMYVILKSNLYSQTSFQRRLCRDRFMRAAALTLSCSLSNGKSVTVCKSDRWASKRARAFCTFVPFRFDALKTSYKRIFQFSINITLSLVLPSLHYASLVKCVCVCVACFFSSYFHDYIHTMECLLSACAQAVFVLFHFLRT